ERFGTQCCGKAVRATQLGVGYRRLGSDHDDIAAAASFEHGGIGYECDVFKCGGQCGGLCSCWVQVWWTTVVDDVCSVVPDSAGGRCCGFNPGQVFRRDVSTVGDVDENVTDDHIPTLGSGFG